MSSLTHYFTAALCGEGVYAFEGKVGAEANGMLALEGTRVPLAEECLAHGEEPVEGHPDGSQVPSVDKEQWFA